MDVDGTLTDGKIYIGNNGEMFKAFDIKDGYGIHDILPQLGIVPIIITGRESQIVANRCKELGIIEIHQGCRVKLKKLKEILKAYGQQDNVIYNLSNVAYIGDDILDLPCIMAVKNSGGLTACPADAIEEVKAAVSIVCDRSAGNGAVREMIGKIGVM